MLVENLVRQLVINSPGTHRLGRVLLAWVQRTLEKRHLSRVLTTAGPELAGGHPRAGSRGTWAVQPLGGGQGLAAGLGTASFFFKILT